MLKLRWKSDTTVPLEAEVVRPDLLAGKSPDEVRSLRVFHGNRQETLGDFFDVAGESGDGRVVVEGDCSRVKHLGAGMTNGHLLVEGNAGMHLGAEMRGGTIEVGGNAGDWVGAEMRGGLIHVRGNAGHLVGAGYRGSAKGMRGGTILVQGNAGYEVGSTMRRGLIAIGGEVGDFAGVSMIAGTVLLFGKVGIRLGAGMNRGTIVVGDGDGDDAASLAENTLLPTFTFDCVYRPVFLAVLLRRLAASGFAVPADILRTSFRRYHGDLVALGKGEVLVREH